MAINVPKVRVIDGVLLIHKGLEKRVSIGSHDEKDRKVVHISAIVTPDFLQLDITYDDNSVTTFAYNIKDVSGYEIYYKVKDIV